MRLDEPVLNQTATERRRAPELPRPFGRRAADQVEVTARQTEVLELVTEGLENKEIAAALGISEQGVKQQVSVLLRKFHVSGRAALVRTAVTMRLLGTRSDTSDVSYEYLFDRAPLAIALTRGPEHRFVLVNEAFVALFGDRGYVGRTFRERFPELPPSVAEKVDRAFRAGEPLRDHEGTLTLDAPSGRRDVHLTYLLEPTRDAGGAVDGLAFYAWDVTDQVTLRRDLERLSAQQPELRDR